MVDKTPLPPTKVRRQEQTKFAVRADIENNSMKIEF